MRRWIVTALEWSVVKRALMYAVVVGTILITINHGDTILAGEVQPIHIQKMMLTVLVPYMVSTFSSVGAMLQLRGD